MSIDPREHPDAQPGSPRHLDALDGVRGLAILIVVIHNASWVLDGDGRFVLKLFTAIAATGWTGVQLFFALSGFLITGILLDARGSEGFFRTFYIRRTLRIFPLYYAFLAVTFFVVPLAVDRPAWTDLVRTNQWWFWAYASNWGNTFGHHIPGLDHFWSLAIEEQFYLLWPLLVFATPYRRLIGICTGVVVATPFVRFLLHAAGLPALALYEFTIARWDALALGCLLAVLTREEPGRQWLRQRMGHFGGAALVALVLFLGVRHGFQEKDLAVQVLGQTIVAVLAAWLIYISMAPVSGIGRTLQNAISGRWLRFLGKYSYAIYVFHFPIHQIAASHVTGWINTGSTLERLMKHATYVGGLGTASILAALVSWNVLEKPFLRLKDRLAPRRAAATLTS